MTTHKREIGLTRTFLQAAARLRRGRPEMDKQIATTFSELLIHPDAPGLHKENVERTRVDHLKSCRVNDGIRLIEQEPPKKQIRALYVDTHDEAYEWARRYTRVDAAVIENWHPSETIDQSFESHTQQEVGIPDSNYTLLEHLGIAAPGEANFSCIPVEKLVVLGLTEGQANHIRAASINTDLSGYISDPEIVERIVDLYYELSISGVPLPVPLASSEDNITISASDQYLQMAEMGLERYLALLTEEQKELAYVEQQSLLVIKGGGGSGKTTVAVHRLRHLADQITRQPQVLASGARKVIYLCFNKVLANVVNQMLETLYGDRPPAHIEVSNLHGWAASYLKERGILAKSSADSNATKFHLADQRYIGGFVANRLNKAKKSASGTFTLLTSLPPSMIAAEIVEVIIGANIKTREEYLAVDRRGRGSGLTQQGRAQIWELYLEMRDEFACQRKVHISMLPGLALEHLEQDSAFTPYEAVIIDEAQDLPPVCLRLAKRMAGDNLAHVTLFADASQSIYQSGFQWKMAELNPRGCRFRTLHLNHRNTAQIHALATSFLRTDASPEELGDYVIAEQPSREGSRPVLVMHANAEEELMWVVESVGEVISQGVSPQNIAILVSNTNMAKTLVKRLEDRGIRAETCVHSRVIHISQPSVKVITRHSAKGLDFLYVYLVGLTEDGIYVGQSQEEREGDMLKAQRRLLYTSMIRAGHMLFMSTVAGSEHLLIADIIDDKFCQIIKGAHNGRC